MKTSKTKAAIMATNPEREKAIDKLEELFNFFRHAEIKNYDFLININKQLDDIRSSLKYVPSEPSFDSLPTEIKTDILNHLCDSGAFVAASVSQEWKQILKRKLNQLYEISLGKHCSNDHQCEDVKCFMPESFLRAAITHRLDVPLSICHPLRVGFNTKLIVEGITSSSNLTITDHCYCKDDDDVPLIFPYQLKDVFKELEKKGKIMDSLQLIDIHMKNLNQITLLNYLLNKVKNLTLDDVSGRMLDGEIFIKNLLQISTNSQLRHLTLEFEYPDDQAYPNFYKDFADAVCKVISVDLRSLPANREEKTAKRLLKNIRRLNVRMKSFELGEDFDWRDVISPGKLKKTLEKMDVLKLVGIFTTAQVEAVQSLPGVEADVHKISKCLI